MDDTSRIARPYAVAAFRQATEEGNLAGWSDMLQLLVAVVRDPQMAGLIADPRVDSRRLGDLVLAVCGEHLTDAGRNLVRLLAENRRLAVVPDIAEAYAEQRTRAERLGRVQLVTAFELDPGQQQAIADAMQRRLGTDSVQLEVSVDAELIGGVLIRAGDLVIDASLRGQLQKLAARVA